MKTKLIQKTVTELVIQRKTRLSAARSRKASRRGTTGVGVGTRCGTER